MSTPQKERPAYITKWSQPELDMIKSICCDTRDPEHFHFFLYRADQLKLNPLMGQIHSVFRGIDKATNKEKRTVITSIDGLRLLAERTGKYVPGEEVKFEYADNPKVPVKAIVYVKKMDDRGNWHNIPGVAFYDEYVQTKYGGEPNKIWAEKPHVMLGKCAEALGLRRAFPTDLAGIYTDEEMAVTIFNEQQETSESKGDGVIDNHQIKQLAQLIGERHDIANRVLKHCGVTKIEELPKKQFEMLHRGIVNIFKKETKETEQEDLAHAN